VPFTDFLRATVFLSAAAASALALVTLLSAEPGGDYALLLIGAGWWVVAAIYGLWIGRKTAVNPGISRLLADARSTPALPDIRPGRVLLNRLWPLALLTLVGFGLGFAMPQVPGIFAGGAIVWALYWRRQEPAVTAIEERDGSRFFVEGTRPWKAISLVRTPGFKSTRFEPASEAPVPTAPS
jgi:hypothetical protein